MRPGVRPIVTLAVAVALSGCTSDAVGGGPSSGPGTSTPSAAATIALTSHSVDGVTIAIPAGWTSQQTEGVSLRLSDPGGATVTVIVKEVVGNTLSDPVYTPSSYLETALRHVLEDVDHTVVTESLTGRAQPIDVPGAEAAATLAASGTREGAAVACSVAAAKVGSNMAVVIGRDIEPRLWQQILATFRIDPDSLEPT